MVSVDGEIGLTKDEERTVTDRCQMIPELNKVKNQINDPASLIEDGTVRFDITGHTMKFVKTF